jgi:hypothetical protein
VASRSHNQSDISGNNEEKLWHGDSNSDCNVSPVRLFRKTSESITRHSLKWLGICSPVVYNNSDNGRRIKVPKISFFGKFDTTGDSDEYESPDEDWYYDPRNKSKWNWENDYCSLASNSEDSSNSIVIASKSSKFID